MFPFTLPAACLFAAIATPALAQTWDDLGGSGGGGGVSGSGAEATQPNVAVGPDGRPVVAWLQKGLGNMWAVYLRKWDDDSWEPLGSSASGDGLSVGTLVHANMSPLRWMALDANGYPTVVWSGKTPSVTSAIYCKRWTGNAWVVLENTAGAGVGIGTTGAVSFPTLAIGTDGHPTVAWIRDLSAGGGALSLKRWKGDAWEGLGDSEIGLAISPNVAAGNSLSVALDALNDPTVAFNVGYVTPQGPCLRRWKGGAWEEVDGSGSPSGLSAHPSCSGVGVRLAANGDIYLTWSAVPVPGGPSQVYVKRWTTDGWGDLDSSGSDPGISGNGDMTTQSFSRYPSMVLDTQSRPVVAWEHKDLSVGPWMGIHLRRWDGTGWVEVGGSATDGGVGASSALNIVFASLALRPDGSFALGWRSADPFTPTASRINLRTHAAPAPGISALAQFKVDGTTPLDPGAITMGQTGFTSRATISSGDGTDIHLEVQAGVLADPVVWTWSAASDPQPTGGSVSLGLSGFPMGARMRWRARAVDESGADSGWKDFGTDAVGETDFWVRDNTAPAPPSAQQLDIATGAPIPTGARIFNTGVIAVLGSVFDPEDDAACFEVELRAMGETFSGMPTAIGPFTLGGAPATIAVPYTGGGAFRWRARARDSFGVSSPWISPGGGSGPDFITIEFGSTGPSGCFQAAGGGGVPIAAILALISALVRRRPCGAP